MEDEYAFYIKYGIHFPNAGGVLNEPLLLRWINDKNKMRTSQILQIKQFNQSYKVPDPPGKYWRENSFDKYDSFFDRNGNHPLDPPV